MLLSWDAREKVIKEKPEEGLQFSVPSPLLAQGPQGLKLDKMLIDCP